MNPPTGDPFTTGGPTFTPQSSRRSGQSDGEGRRMFPYPVPPIEENVLDEGKLLKPWDTKKLPLLSSRPKSCEVPGIKRPLQPEATEPLALRTRPGTGSEVDTGSGVRCSCGRRRRELSLRPRSSRPRRPTASPRLSTQAARCPTCPASTSPPRCPRHWTRTSRVTQDPPL
ncbi:hypothetical protein INR49_007272 [Caranx melampygus]|nr:hypothetical protein INR49_007272 [Caranx melampygus]